MSYKNENHQNENCSEIETLWISEKLNQSFWIELEMTLCSPQGFTLLFIFVQNYWVRFLPHQTMTHDFLVLSLEKSITHDVIEKFECKWISWSSRFECYYARSLTRDGRLRRPDAIWVVNKGQQKPRTKRSGDPWLQPITEPISLTFR